MDRRSALKILSSFSLGLGTLSIYSAHVFQEYIPKLDLFWSKAPHGDIPKDEILYVASVFENKMTKKHHWAPFPIFLNGTDVSEENVKPVVTSVDEFSDFLLGGTSSGRILELDAKKRGLIFEYLAISRIEFVNGQLQGINEAFSIMEQGLRGPKVKYTRRQFELFAKLSLLHTNDQMGSWLKLTKILEPWREIYSPEYLDTGELFEKYRDFMHNGDGYSRFVSSIKKRNKWLSSTHNLWA